MTKVLFMNASPNKDGATVSIAKKLLKDNDYDTMEMSDYNVSQFGSVRDNDQMKEMLNIIKDYDPIVIGTPVYFYTVSGILKTFIDRLYLLDESECLKGKSLYFFAQGYAPDEETEKPINYLITKMTNLFGIKLESLVVDNSEGHKVLKEINIK